MDNGKEFGYWVGGTNAYAGCVLIVNVLILMKFNIHDGYNIVSILAMILSYFVILGVMSSTGQF